MTTVAGLPVLADFLVCADLYAVCLESVRLKENLLIYRISDSSDERLVLTIRDIENVPELDWQRLCEVEYGPETKRTILINALGIYKNSVRQCDG